MSDYTDSVTIENAVAATGIDQELDLESLAMDMTGSNYQPEKFPGLIYKTEDPAVTALIFRSGKIVLTGANSVGALHEAADILVDLLAEYDIDVPDEPAVSVENIVSSADVDATLNLNAIAIGFGLENVEYEPEQFPGLVYRLDEVDVVVLAFGSGKLVITGAKEVDDVYEGLEETVSELSDLGLLE